MGVVNKLKQIRYEYKRQENQSGSYVLPHQLG